MRSASEILYLATKKAELTDLKTRTRILQGVMERLHTVLINSTRSGTDVEFVIKIFQNYLKLYSDVVRLGVRLNYSIGQQRRWTSTFLKNLHKLSAAAMGPAGAASRPAG